MALFFPMPGNEPLAIDLARMTLGELGDLELRQFPDGETYVRIISDVDRKDVYIVCTLARPDAWFLPLTFAAAAIFGLGARRVQLIAPYLAYMRQDLIFHPGEALTSRLFAQQLQQHFDGLITVDPHLHRHASLEEIYDIPTKVVHAGPLLANWIANNVAQPVIIGPDAESAQWVEGIAREAAAPWTLFNKERRGDRDIQMTAVDFRHLGGRTPVLVDDIVSSGATMRSALRILAARGFPPAYCLAVHGLCGRRTATTLKDRSAGFLTSNSVPNNDAAFDVAPLIADELIRSSARSLTPAVGLQHCRRRSG